MTVYSKRVGAGSEESSGPSASVEYWLMDGKITITINGITCMFPTYVGNNKLHTMETIAILKEAVAEL
jgi:hypothetical protein